MSKVIAFLLPISPDLAILNLGIDDIPPSLRIVLMHVLLAARLTPVRS